MTTSQPIRRIDEIITQIRKNPQYYEPQGKILKFFEKYFLEIKNLSIVAENSQQKETKEVRVETIFKEKIREIFVKKEVIVEKEVFVEKEKWTSIVEALPISDIPVLVCGKKFGKKFIELDSILYGSFKNPNVQFWRHIELPKGL